MPHLTMPDWLPGETGPPESRRGKPKKPAPIRDEPTPPSVLKEV